MHQHVARPDGREDVGVGIDAERRLRGPGRIAQLADRQRGDLEQAGIVEHVRQLVDVALAQVEARSEAVADLAARTFAELEPHDRLEPPLPHLLLDHLLDAVVAVFLDRDVGIARHAEQRGGFDLDAGEQAGSVDPHQLLQRDEAALPGLDAGAHRQPLRQL